MISLPFLSTPYLAGHSSSGLRRSYSLVISSLATPCSSGLPPRVVALLVHSVSTYIWVDSRFKFTRFTLRFMICSAALRRRVSRDREWSASSSSRWIFLRDELL